MIIEAIKPKIQAAISKVFGPEFSDTDPLIRFASSKYGDVQSNVSMFLSNKVGLPANQVATKLVEAIGNSLDEFCEKPHVTGGFINLTIKEDFLKKVFLTLRADQFESLKNYAPYEPKSHTFLHKSVLVDYSSPNVAKKMHIGHLRSTVIGDCLCRCYEACGYKVYPVNHVGDWGTQFGMMIELLAETHPELLIDRSEVLKLLGGIDGLTELYKTAKQKFDADPVFADKAKTRLVLLQEGDEWTNFVWEQMRSVSITYFNEVYAALEIENFKDGKNVKGESFYNQYLSKTVEQALELSVAVETEGAVGIFLEGYYDKDGKPLPFLIKKQDGGYLYATTDLAALRYRMLDHNPQEILYVTDSRQSQHFEMLFKSADKMGWMPHNKFFSNLKHVPFGSILGKDGKPFKTREGEAVGLMEVYNEAVDKATSLTKEKHPHWDDSEIQKIAKALALAALKFSDLSTIRTKDYVFDLDKMLSMEGQTGPYLLYAVARIESLANKNTSGYFFDPEKFSIKEKEEKELVIKMSQFKEAVWSVIVKHEPNHLCNHLYELCKIFNTYYAKHQILKSERKADMVEICEIVSDQICKGLDLLGIPILEAM